MIKTWSYSLLKKFEKCPHMVYLEKVAKLPGPPQEETAANVRGTRIHALAEAYVKRELDDLPTELSKFAGKLDELRDEYSQGNVHVEEDWGFDENLCDTGWFDDNVWLRVKCDAVLIHEGGTGITVIDYKTGKSFGNEVSHIQQAQLYAAAAFLKFPNAASVSAEMWYLDEGKTKPKLYTRDNIQPIAIRLFQRGKAITDAVAFPAKANIHNCRFCDYGPNKGTGACHYGVPCAL